MAEEKGMDRRTAMKIISGTILFGSAAAAAATKGINLNKVAEGHNNLPTTPIAPDKKATPTEQLVFNENGVKVWYIDGIPVSWEDNNNKGEFDREKLLEIQRQADEKNEHMVAQVVRVQGNEVVSTPTPKEVSANEGIKKLPKDVVSRKDLADRGIEIFDTPNVGFHIRQSAFSEGGLMERYKKGGERKLKILLTTNPTLTQEAFLGLQNVDHKVILQTLISADEAKHRFQVNWKPGDNEQLERHEQLLPFITTDEIVKWGLVGGVGIAKGCGDEGGSVDTDYLFLAISEKQAKPQSIKCIQILVGPENWSDAGFNVSLHQVDLDEMFAPTRPIYLDPTQSYTDPKKYTRLASHGEGTFEWKVLAGVDPATKDPYFVAMHELEHMNFYAQKAAQTVNPEGVENMRFYSEQEVDWTTWSRLKLAYDNYILGDDSDYPIVLENKKDNYFVIG
ncbi:hypothetical protein IPM62_03960 [Candidatus Woesebacteria bacterium]|nr:MAG: hypothetical protein IPM62_03960 [Candidatus Woesebacteria bacterium]